MAAHPTRIPFRLCSSLYHPDCVYDLRTGSLSDAWHNFVPQVWGMRSDRRKFLETCRVCPLINLCLWCPAHAYLETGALDGATPYFCDVAHARTEALKKNLTKGIAQQPPLCHPLHAISQEVPGT